MNRSAILIVFGSCSQGQRANEEGQTIRDNQTGKEFGMVVIKLGLRTVRYVVLL